MDHKGGDGDKAKEGEVCFLVTNGKTPILFDFSKEHFDARSPFVDCLVINNRLFPVFSPGNHRNVVVGMKRIAMLIAVVALIFDDKTAKNVGSQRVGYRDIRYVSTRQLSFDNAVIRCGRKMQLGRYASPVSPSRAVPPFEPPPWR